MELQSTSSDFKMDLESSCRVCMKTSKNMMQIFSKKVIEDCLSEKITFCTGLQIAPNDGLPAQICDNCTQELQIAHKFKTTCIDSEKTYHKLLKSKIKSELDSNMFCNNDMDITNFFDDDNRQDDAFFSNFVENSIVKVEISDLVKKKTPKKPRSPKKAKGTSTAEPAKRKRQKPVIRSQLKVKQFCVECDLAFDNKKDFREHNKTVHKKTSFMCEICGKVFKHQSSQSCHLLTHRDPKFFCHHCDYRTTYRQDLITHMRIHTGLKKYACDYCPATFRTSSNRLAHMRRTHQKLQRFTCHLCGRGFYDKFEFQRHMDSHQDVKRYTCELCDGRFSRRNHWKKHLFRQHNVVVPIQKSGRKREPDLVKVGPNGRAVQQECSAE